MESACRHDTSEHSTLTLMIPLGRPDTAPSWLHCSVCGCRLELGPVPLVLSWHVWQRVLSQSAFFTSMGETSSFSLTDSSSSSPVPTADETDDPPAATSGKTDSPVRSPSWPPMTFSERSTFLKNAIAEPGAYRLTVGGTVSATMVNAAFLMRHAHAYRDSPCTVTRWSDGLSIAVGLEELDAALRP